MNSIKTKLENIDFKQLKNKSRRLLLGMNLTDGILYKVVVYLMLISLGFIFLFPIFYMIVTSLKTDEDILNTSIQWIPTVLHFENYADVFKQIGLVPNEKLNFFGMLKWIVYNNSLSKTIIVAGLPALLTTLSTSLAAYGFSRFNFPLKKIFFGIMLASFIITPQILHIPQYVWYKKIGLLGSLLPYVLPATFAQGLSSTLFILIFWSMFNMVPKSLEEAAKLDGANSISIFIKIAIPLSLPAFLITFLFSFVWYWNEVNLASLYFRSSTWTTLPLKLQIYMNFLAKQAKSAIEYQRFTPEIMAAILVVIIPLLILYFALQKYFVESIDRTGITGE